MNELSIFDSLFNDVFGKSRSATYSPLSSPRVDVMEEEKSYVLEMELPGRSEDDVNIELDHDNLTIASKTQETKQEESEKPAAKYILKERYANNFERRFMLPADVNTEDIKASFKNGILTIYMGKKENAAPKKIAIEAC